VHIDDNAGLSTSAGTVVFATELRPAGRRMKQLAGALRRRTGVTLGEMDRPTGEVGRMARQRCGTFRR
jgi:hypothetical protein